MGQTFKVVTTPRARFQLARLLLDPKIKLKDRNKERALDRSRRDLGLDEITEQLIDRGRVGEIYRDNANAATFTVTEDEADVIIRIAGDLEKDPAIMFYLDDLLEQLETKKDHPDAAATADLDAAAEAPKWRARLGVVVDQPELLASMLKDVFAIESWGHARKAGAEACDRILTPPPEDSPSDKRAEA